MAASHAHEVHLSPKLGFHDRQSHNTGVFDRVGRHECKSQACSNHRQGPVIALTPIGWWTGNSLFLQNMVSVTSDFAVDQMDINIADDLSNCTCEYLCNALTSVDSITHFVAK